MAAGCYYTATLIDLVTGLHYEISGGEIFDTLEAAKEAAARTCRQCSRIMPAVLVEFISVDFDSGEWRIVETSQINAQEAPACLGQS